MTENDGKEPSDLMASTNQAFRHSPPPEGYDPYETLPPWPVLNEPLEPRELMHFLEVWDKDYNFTGDLFDFLDDKVRAFLRHCYYMNIRPGQFHAVFSYILTGRAKLYYFDHVSRNDTFAATYSKMKSKFDPAIHRNYYFNIFSFTTFDSVRQENSDKGPSEVLQLLLDKLESCQRALGPGYPNELRDAVLSACWGSPELEYALRGKPSRSYEELVSNLRSSIEFYFR